jgi:hypothetical protein
MAINPNNIKQELVVFLRNQDVLTISQRGVSTTTHTETLSVAGSATITRTNVKNIRSITVDASPLSFGTDYTVDYGDGTENCVVTFVANQTGDLIISYDYGTDKIWPDFPRDDLSISSYPRIAVDILNVPSDAFGIGGAKFISDINFTVVVYANNSENIDTYINSIRSAFIDNAKDFFYLDFIKPTLMGPTISDPNRKEEIMHRNQDFSSKFNVETAS